MSNELKIEPVKEFIQVFDIVEKLSVSKLREILSYPMINLLQETVDYTRSYDSSLITWFNLLEFVEKNMQYLNEKEQNKYLEILYSAILHCLDCLDRWEDYLELWEKIFLNVTISHKFSYDPPKSKDEINDGYYEDIEKYLIYEDTAKGGYCVHFLYHQSDRKKLIERKIAKKRAGKKIGNLFHAKQEDLSDEEIQKRYEWMKKKAEYVNKVELLIKKASRSN